jgi:hypothetical protein
LSGNKEVHCIHIEVPIELWKEFKKIVPESGVTSIIIRRLLRDYVNAIRIGHSTIEVTKLCGFNKQRW